MNINAGDKPVAPELKGSFLTSKLVKSFDSGSSGAKMQHRRYRSSGGSSNVSSSSTESILTISIYQCHRKIN
jgi:hypothetical protein